MSKKTLSIFTNDINGGLNPFNFKKGLYSGSEDILYIFTQSFKEEYDITVYYDSGDKNALKRIDLDGIKWVLKSEFSHEEWVGVFISFKNRNIWTAPINAVTKIHWSVEIERIFDTSQIDYVVAISDYHNSKNFWIEPSKKKVIGCPVDDKYFDSKKTFIKKEQMLYCSSPDRGLETLLIDWPKIKRMMPEMKLKVAYGFSVFDKITAGNPAAQEYKNRIMKLMEQTDVEYLGWLTPEQLEKQYEDSKYWMLPLNNAESELFCINAIKAQAKGAIPVINRMGGLKNTCKLWIEYKGFLECNLSVKTEYKNDINQYKTKNITKKWREIL